MEGGPLVMNHKERYRLVVMSRVKEGTMALKEASEVMGVSYRQSRRLYKRYKEEGDKGVIHRSRGRPSCRRKPAELKEKVLGLYQERYWDFGPTLAAEKLALEGYEVDHETLRRWLLSAGLWKKQRRRSRYKKRRERKAHFGEMVQLDGSHHGWFSDNEEKACLMDMVDDATGMTLSIMSKEETTIAAMQVLWAWVGKHGIPRALYVDYKSVYITQREPTVEEQLSGNFPLTQFGKACKKLGIEIIPAGTPQAKGRVERKHGVYQDRFVKELRLQGIQDIEGANRVLSEFADDINGKFAVEPTNSVDLHLKVPAEMDLRNVFCFEKACAVSNDWVVRYHNRFFQLQPQSNLPPARKKVFVQEHLDGTIHITYRDKEVVFTELTEPPQKKSASSRKERGDAKPKQRYIPPQDHPWRRFNMKSISGKKVPAR